MEAGTITDHYSFGGLRQRIEAALAASDVPPTVESLSPVDEFHLGGRAATAHLITQLDLSAEHRVLDVGCGLGGTARFIAATTGAAVAGIDLTPEYVDVGTWLTGLVGLTDRVDLRVGSALDLPFESESFDAATMIHVGMNIEDKARLFADIHRTLVPSGKVAVYDIMAVAAGDLQYPVPWAAGPETSAVATAETYTALLEGAGFEIVAIENRLPTITPPTVVADGDGPRLGLHLVMGPEAGSRFANMGVNLRAGLLAPIEIIAVSGR